MASFPKSTPNKDTLVPDDARSRAILAAIPDLILHLDQSGAILDFVPGDGINLLTGSVDLVGRQISQVLPPNVVNVLLEKGSEARRSGITRHHEFQLTLNSRLCDYEARLAPIHQDELLLIIRDISARKQAERNLLNSESLYHSLVENLPQNIFRKDRQGCIVYANPRYCATQDKPLADIIGKTDFDLHPAILAEKYWHDDHRVMKTGTILETIEEHHPLNGPKSFVHIVKSPVYDSSGQIIGVQGIFWDITDRKNAEEEIHRRNRELTLLNRVIAAAAVDQPAEAILDTACRELARGFNLSGVSAMLLNPQKTTLTFVAQFHPIGVPSLLQQTISVENEPGFKYLFFSKAPWPVEDTLLEPRLNSVRPILEATHTRSLLILPLVVAGEMTGTINLGASQPRVFSANEISLAWSVADQISGVLARSKLIEAYRRLAIAVEQSASGIMITDIDGTISYVNPAFEHMAGYDRNEVLGRHFKLLQSDQQPESVYTEMWATVSAGQVWRGQLVKCKKNGQFYTTDTTITPVRDDAHSVTNFVAVQRDITRELALEEQYRQSQKMEAVGQLTAGIAHDFNNILTGITGFADLMERKLTPDDPLHHYATRIGHAGERAANLIRQLMVFSRKQVVEPELLLINQVVTEIQNLLTRIIGEHIRMETELEPNLWHVFADPGQLEQVIVNLAVNGRDSMPHGGTLRITTANVVLDEIYAASHVEVQPGEYVMLAVTDTGHGMTEAVMARIFEPFFTTKERGKGTGLGLATVYAIVKQSNGHIRVESEPGQGATFFIYLPRLKQAVSTQPLPPSPGDMAAGTETVLLVEDDDDVRDLVGRILINQGYSLLVANNGQTALQLAADPAAHIDLLLTDVIMPGTNGKALAEALTQARPGLKVLFMTGYAEEIISQYGLLDQHMALLQKPFSPVSLVGKVRAILDG